MVRYKKVNKRFPCFSHGIRKKGISAIVATVLIILITVAAITITWVAIIPLIQNNLASTKQFNVRLGIDSSSGYTVYDKDRGIFMVRVTRSSGDDVIVDKMKITLNFEGNSYSEVVDAPKPNQALTYSFNILDYVLSYGLPDSVSVVPIFVNGNKVREGSFSSKAEIPFGTIVSIPENLDYHFGDGDCLEGDTQVCGISEGECNIGTMTCLEGNFWGVCGGDYVGSETEICDEKDHDCDGANTNGLTCDCTAPGTTQGTTCGIGACARIGEETCTDGQWVGDTCVAGTAVAETCNNIDDDCDGIVDGINRPCGEETGACNPGIHICTSGIWGDCGGDYIGPITEDCATGIDEDCDGYSGCDDSDCVGDLTCAIVEYVWQENTNTKSGPYSWGYIMGYEFVPQENKEVIELCRYGGGTKMVYLYDNSYNVLASVSITGSGASWTCEPISLVSLTSGSTYYVVENVAGSEGYFTYDAGLLPIVYNQVNITTGVYQSGAIFDSNHYSSPLVIYGEVDIGIVA